MALLPLYARPPFMNLLGLGWTSVRLPPTPVEGPLSFHSQYLALVNSRAVKTVPTSAEQDAQLTAAKIEL
jgi:hypothetical protein